MERSVLVSDSGMERSVLVTDSRMERSVLVIDSRMERSVLVTDSRMERSGKACSIPHFQMLHASNYVAHVTALRSQQGSLHFCVHGALMRVQGNDEVGIIFFIYIQE